MNKQTGIYGEGKLFEQPTPYVLNPTLVNVQNN